MLVMDLWNRYFWMRLLTPNFIRKYMAYEYALVQITLIEGHSYMAARLAREALNV